jgi:predicted HAD superfamily Cof-like phosphohydrolase
MQAVFYFALSNPQNLCAMSDQLTLIQTIRYVEEFHDAFGLPVRKEPTGLLSDKESSLRFHLMKEENEEYLEAARQGDIVEIADALGDMLYILCGTINAHGLQHKMAEVFEEIQRSNMSKLDENGKPIYREDGKVLKSGRYFRPDISAILGVDFQDPA